MSIAEKLLTVVENEQKIHDEVVGQSDLIAQIKAKVNSLPEAGGGEKPTLFAPSISLQSVTSVLTITDNRNGDFVQGYNVYANDNLITVLTSKEVTLTDFIEHTETIEIKVQATATNFNPSEFITVEWVLVNVDGTAGLAYSLSSNGTYASCTGIGEAIETDIEIASEYEGVPVIGISSNAFKECSSLTSVVIPDSVTFIDGSAFSGCSSLTSVTLPRSLKSSGQNAFSGCSSITKVNYNGTIDDWVQIEFSQYSYGNPLRYAKNLYINDELVTQPNITTATEIEYEAFRNSSITSAIIGNSVKNIKGFVFYGCENLKRVDFSSHTSVPTLSSNAFNSTHVDLQIKVPADLIDSWKTATNWSNHASKIVTEFTNTL